MSVVTLADLKSYANFKGVADDTALQATIDSAEAIVAHWVGPLAPTTVTQRFYNASLSAVLSLSTIPVISVTSVTGSDGAVVPLANLDIDLVSGTIYPDTTGWINRWALNRYTVVYQAGYTSLPKDIYEGIVELCRVLWQPRKGGGRGGPASADGSPMPVELSSFVLPARARAYLDPYIPLGIG